MSFQPADDFSLSLFAVFSLLMGVGVFYSLFKIASSQKWSFLFGILVALFSLAALSGVVIRHFIPLGPILIGLILIFGISFSFSGAAKTLASALPFSVLIGFQGFRLPLELLLHHWADLKTVPPTMTWTGQNFDIISGILCLIVVPWVNRSRPLALAINTTGLLLLLNVFRVVVLSAPLPFAWPLENPLVLIAYFPYALIGPLFVLPALIGHLLTYRKLSAESTLHSR